MWTPPKNFASDIVFRATVVQSKNVFWTAIDSEPIEVSSSGVPYSVSPNGRLNTFNIHNPNPSSYPESVNSPQVPSGFVVNKDAVGNGHSPYHVAPTMNPPQSPFLSVPQQPLVQRFPLSPDSHASSREHHYYLDYNVCSRKLCFGLPSGCLRKRTCIMLLTASFVPYTDATVEFEIIADHKSAFSNKRLASFGLSSSITTTSAYYSMAFSHDKVMGKGYLLTPF